MVRAYTSACVAASTAVSDGAAMIALGRAERVVVAAGYLVDSDQFALFDAGRALAPGGELWCVWNSHLGYRPLLDRIGETRQVSRNAKFVVTATRRR